MICFGYKYLWIIFIFLLLLTPSFAYDNSTWRCTDYNTSEYNDYVYINGTQTNVTRYEKCPFNCTDVTGRCNLDPYDINIGSVGILIVIPLLAFIFVYMAKNSSFTLQFHNFAFDPMQLLFLGLALFMIIIDISLALNYATNMNQTPAVTILTGGYTAVIWGFVIVAFTLAIFFIYSVFKMLIDYARKRR